MSIKEKIKSLVWNATRVVIPIYIGLTLASNNGCLDSERTKTAMRNHKTNNTLKTIAQVKEKWKDNSDLDLVSSILGGSDYNPRVIRRVTFEDGSTTQLDYRVMAHQPFMRWIHGNEFDPKPGERYEVTKYNAIVQKID